MAFGNVTLFDTYEIWRSITNQQVLVMNDITSNGNLIRFRSNSIGVSVTANIPANGRVYITMNTTNSVSNTSTFVFATANATNTVHKLYRQVFNQANAAY